MKSKHALFLCLFFFIYISSFAQENDTIICKNPDTLARFNGNLIDFLNQQLVYPTIAMSAKIEAKLTITFIVEKDGRISNISIPYKKGWGMDEEALRLVSIMPNWIPASYQGKAVRSVFYLAIHFELVKSNLTDSFIGTIADDEIYSFSEHMPQMINQTVYQYIENHLVYPSKEKKKGVEGSVVVQFLINRHGAVSEAEIIKSANKNFDKAVLKAIYEMPNWNPAQINGRPVLYRYTLPVKFKLN